MPSDGKIYVVNVATGEISEKPTNVETEESDSGTTETAGHDVTLSKPETKNSPSSSDSGCSAAPQKGPAQTPIETALLISSMLLLLGLRRTELNAMMRRRPGTVISAVAKYTLNRLLKKTIFS